jgi:hypothetical protein
VSVSVIHGLDYYLYVNLIKAAFLFPSPSSLRSAFWIMKKSLISCLTDSFKSIPSLPTTSLKDKTVLITGANTGLGFEAAKHLASLNPTRLIIGCRNLDKGNAATKKIKEDTGFTGILEVWIVDLAEFSSVKAFIERAVGAEGGLERLDLLVLNAGVAQHTNLKYIATTDGFEHA